VKFLRHQQRAAQKTSDTALRFGRNVLRGALVVLFVFSGLMPLPAAVDEPYKQTYVILINGEKAGTEAVTEEKDGSGNVVSMSEHELLLDEGSSKNRMVFSTKMVLSKGAKNIKTYVCRYKGEPGDSYEVSVQNGRITRVLTRNGQPGVVTAPFTSNMVVVDFNVYHHYEYLLRRYDRKKKGIQTFADFIPIIGNDIPIKVTWVGDENLVFGEKTIEASRFIIEFTDIHTVTLYADKDNRLVVLENTAQGLKVIREDLLN